MSQSFNFYKGKSLFNAMVVNFPTCTVKGGYSKKYKADLISVFDPSGKWETSFLIDNNQNSKKKFTKEYVEAVREAFKRKGIEI